jgi:hypothetical protein
LEDDSLHTKQQEPASPSSLEKINFKQIEYMKGYFTNNTSSTLFTKAGTRSTNQSASIALIIDKILSVFGLR